MNKIVIFGILVLLLAPASVYSVEITKTSSSSAIYPGDTITITLEVLNDQNSQLKGTLYDLPPKFAIVSGAEMMPNDPLVLDNGSIVTFFRTELPIVFDVDLGPNERKTYSYQLTFESIPDAVVNKNFPLPRARIISDSEVEYYATSQNLSLKTNETIVCNYNFKCDEGENHINCLNDCLSGYEDDLCDGLTDYRCDPDCSNEEDPDCTDPTVTGKIIPVPDDVKEETETKTVQDTISGQSQPDNTLIYVILILLAIALIYFIYSKKTMK